MSGAVGVRLAAAAATLVAAVGFGRSAAPGEAQSRSADTVRVRAGDVVAVAARVGSSCVRRFVRVSRDSVVVVGAGPRLPCRPPVAVFRPGFGVVAVGPRRPPSGVLVAPQFWRVAVPVHFIAATAPLETALGWIGPAFADLQQLYADNDVGVEFVDADTELVTKPPDFLTHGCTQAMVEGFVHSKYYHPDTLNVVLLDSIEGFWTQEGLTCFLQMVDGKPATNVIFIGLLYRSDATFPHEVGHALALQGKTCGHVNDLLYKPGCETIDSSNLMIQRHAEMDPDLWMYRDHFTRGQVYRMTYDAGSFLNLAGLRIGAVVQCQTTCCGLTATAADYGCAGDPGTPCLRLADDDPPSAP